MGKTLKDKKKYLSKKNRKNSKEYEDDYVSLSKDQNKIRLKKQRKKIKRLLRNEELDSLSPDSLDENL